jgi:hypothetical protein
VRSVGEIGGIAQSIWIGVHRSRYFVGRIDDIRIYDRVLNDDEVLSLFNELNPVESATWGAIKRVFPGENPS